MKVRISDDQIYCSFGYMPLLSEKLKRQCGAKWNADTKEWYFDAEFREKADKIFLPYLAESTQDTPKIKIQYNAADFDAADPTGRSNRIEINGCVFAARENRDAPVSLYKNTFIIEGVFANRGGSASNPAIGEFENVILRSEVSQDFYYALSDKDKSKMQIIATESEKLDSLKAEEQKLLARLEEVRAKIAELEK